MASLAQVSDVRTSPSDTDTHPLARLWSGLTDAQLLTHLSRASRKAEGIVGARLLPFSVTETVTFAPTGENVTVSTFTTSAQWSGWLGNAPLLRPELWTGTVSAVTGLDSTDTPVTVDLTGLNLTTSTGRVLLPFSALSGFAGRYTVQVAVTGGYSPAPEDLVEATILLCGDSWLVGTDTRNNQYDAADLWSRAMSTLKPWVDARPPRLA